MPSSGETPDLFTSEDAQAIPGAENGRVREDLEVSKTPSAHRSVPIIYFAQEQKRLYEAGMKSASEYWLARGRIWP